MKTAQDQIESLAFRLQHAPGVGAATLRSILRRMQQDGLNASAFLTLEDRELQGRFKMKSEACDFLRRQDDSLDTKWLQLEKMGVHVLVDGQPGYPAKLSRTLAGSAPPVLYAMGNLDLLESPSVGFGGSRKASEKGIKITEDSSALLARQGINVVSGYAQGVDLAAHCAALEAGGSTTLVLAEGMLNFRIKEDLRRFFDASPSHMLRTMPSSRSACPICRRHKSATVAPSYDAVRNTAGLRANSESMSVKHFVVAFFKETAGPPLYQFPPFVKPNFLHDGSTFALCFVGCLPWHLKSGLSCGGSPFLDLFHGCSGAIGFWAL